MLPRCHWPCLIDAMSHRFGMAINGLWHVGAGLCFLISKWATDDHCLMTSTWATRWRLSASHIAISTLINVLWYTYFTPSSTWQQHAWHTWHTYVGCHGSYMFFPRCWMHWLFPWITFITWRVKIASFWYGNSRCRYSLYIHGAFGDGDGERYR